MNSHLKGNFHGNEQYVNHSKLYLGGIRIISCISYGMLKFLYSSALRHYYDVSLNMMCDLFFFSEFYASNFSVDTEDGYSRRLKYLLKMIKILSLWYSRVAMRFLTNEENELFRNLEISTLKLERSHTSCSMKHVIIITYFRTIQVLLFYNKFIIFSKPLIDLFSSPTSIHVPTKSTKSFQITALSN